MVTDPGSGGIDSWIGIFCAYFLDQYLYTALKILDSSIAVSNVPVVVHPFHGVDGRFGKVHPERNYSMDMLPIDATWTVF